MTRSKEQKAADRERFRQLPPAKKAEHIWIYYKWFIILGVAVLVIAAGVVSRILSRKEPHLYMAFFNVSVSEELETGLTRDYLLRAGLDPDRTELVLYRGLYLSREATGDSQRSAYASQIKLQASTELRQLDLVLMSGQAYDFLSARGYLMPIRELCGEDAALLQRLEPCIQENSVTLSDNEIEYLLGEAEEHEIQAEPAENALLVNELPLFAGLYNEPVYLGVVANSPRTGECRAYLSDLFSR